MEGRNLVLTCCIEEHVRVYKALELRRRSGWGLDCGTVACWVVVTAYGGRGWCHWRTLGLLSRGQAPNPQKCHLWKTKEGLSVKERGLQMVRGDPKQRRSPRCQERLCLGGKQDRRGCFSSGCCNKTLQTGWVINNRHLFLTVLEARSPGSRCQQILYLVKTYFLACR